MFVDFRVNFIKQGYIVYLFGQLCTHPFSIKLDSLINTNIIILFFPCIYIASWKNIYTNIRNHFLLTN